METEQRLLQAYDRVKHLIPDYEWTTIYSRGAVLKHIPSNIYIDVDSDGYYLVDSSGHQCDMIVDGDFVHATTDANETVVNFVTEVIRWIAEHSL